MPVTPNDLAATLYEMLEATPSSAAQWTLIRWEAQQDQPDAGRGLARLLHRTYHYTIGQLAQLSEFDRRTLAQALIRYYQNSGGMRDVTAAQLLAEWQIAIDHRAAARAMDSNPAPAPSGAVSN